MISIIREELGQSPRVINVPGFMTLPTMKAEKKHLDSEGKESGLDPLKLMQDILCREFYLDPEPSRAALGYSRGGVEEALRATVRASYPVQSSPIPVSLRTVRRRSRTRTTPLS